MDLLARHVPLIGTLRDYSAAEFKDDLAAGLTTAIMLIPQAMAYAMLAGLDPIIGLYASILPIAAYAFFGTSRQLAVGPVAMVSLLVASGVGALAAPGTPAYLSYAILLSLMVGVMQLGMGLARLGFLVNFLSHPVVSGFTSAAALIIGLSQLKHVLGVDIERSHHVHEILLEALEHAGDIHPLTVGIAGLSIAALMTMKAWNPKFPRFLVVVAAGTLAVWGLGLDAQGVAIVGSVPAGLPGPVLPTVEFEAVQALFPMALTISLVGFMESISVAKNFARQYKYEVDADQELKGLGIANLVGSVFQAYPVTGGFSRTAVNAQAGARTGVAALITAAVVAITLMFLTPLFYFLPKAILAAIIMTAVFGLIDVAEAKHLWHVSKPDLALMGITFAATLTLGIEQGILVGVLASIAWFMRNVTAPHVAVLGRLPGTSVYRKLERNPEAEPVPGALIVRIDAPLFYANTNFLKATLRDLEEEAGEVRVVILDATGVGYLDASAAGAFDELAEDYAERGLRFYLAGVRGPVRDVFERSGFMDAVGRDAFVHRVEHAVQRHTGEPALEVRHGAA